MRGLETGHGGEERCGELTGEDIERRGGITKRLSVLVLED
jgi:hypothetical protein